MKNKLYLNSIIEGDSVEKLAILQDESIDVIITDPPYFLDKMDTNWNSKTVNSKANQKIVTSLPAGMKFDREQGIQFYKWFYGLSEDLFRVLKPGGFLFSFSSPRLYHRLASAADDRGFLIKDCFAWIYTQNQPKAMSLNHFIDKMNITEEKKDKIKRKLEGWKTPQLKSCFEPILMAQKPYNKSYLENMIENDIGLFNTEIKIGNNKFPSNLLLVDSINEIMDNYFLIEKPKKKEKREYNDHKTVKPLSLIKHLILLSTYNSKSIVLDPFMGSGTTALAAKMTGRHYIGIEINREYIEIANKRIIEYEEELINKPMLFN